MYQTRSKLNRPVLLLSFLKLREVLLFQVWLKPIRLDMELRHYKRISKASEGFEIASVKISLLGSKNCRMLL